MPGVLYNVYAPATAYINSVRKSTATHEYGLVFKMTGTNTFRIDHIHVLNQELEAKITAELGGTWEETSPFIGLNNSILVQAGDVLRQTDANINWDWYVGEGSATNTTILYPDCASGAG